LIIDLPGGRFLKGAIAASFMIAVKSAELYLSDILIIYYISALDIDD